jgi:hypothetical protein
MNLKTKKKPGMCFIKMKYSFIWHCDPIVFLKSFSFKLIYLNVFLIVLMCLYLK